MPRGTPVNALYCEAKPKRDTFFRLQEYERLGISQVEVYERREICPSIKRKKIFQNGKRHNKQQLFYTS